MTDRLRIYNGALLLCKERALRSLSENVEPRHLLDLVWNDGGLRYCLEQGLWHFAMRFSQLDYNSAIEPTFGFSRVFDKPDDWVATGGVFEDDRHQDPLTQYADEQGYWFADRDVIYVKYVSDDVGWGMDLGKWPTTFTDYVKAYFAGRICHKLAGADSLRDFLLGTPGREDRGHVNRCLMIAKNKAAQALPATFPSRGTWASARHQSAGRPWADGGNRSRLIG